MSEYYIHKVGSQEMGSVEKNNGKPQRGRYFLISKECLNFFPHLSSVSLNDKAPVFIVPTYIDTPVKVLCTIDYHNQKTSLISYAGNNPRDEVRLYMNQQIDPNLYFRTGDLAVFEKFDTEGDTIYGLSRLREGDDGYNQLKQYLQENARKPYHSHSLMEKELSFIRKPKFTDQTIISVSSDAESYMSSASKELLKHDEDETRIVEEQMGGQLFNSVSFRQFVLFAYDYKCAITRKVIRYENLCNLEAAHIKPQAHNGLFLPCNGIAMSRDMHFAFDKGFFTITNDMKIEVAERLRETDFYKEYNGMGIYVPKIDFYRPNIAFLKYHHDNIFETFAQIRKL